MGKNIARETNLSTWEELYEFFQYMGWGELTLIKEKKKEIIFQLKGHIIEKRLSQKLYQVDFRLECGFLAQMTQVITGDTYECLEEKNLKGSVVEITAIKG
ncbi:YslB family protein [Halobacillus shinanisalinarum]|uniref:YslB family protein n=1 Tax=Halobacillus shinanisalinarum TaxID=2932258 RepID=A0ABY4H158_9BACI|nr:DUF2507 domain-containing protein [Halobacillus shinanisalinarum]UOQ94074.1 YslB family protein [Halobacillus shinanisalinarum]